MGKVELRAFIYDGGNRDRCTGATGHSLRVTVQTPDGLPAEAALDEAYAYARDVLATGVEALRAPGTSTATATAAMRARVAADRLNLAGIYRHAGARQVFT